jgi:hypothetical protein
MSDGDTIETSEYSIEAKIPSKNKRQAIPKDHVNRSASF